MDGLGCNETCGYSPCGEIESDSMQRKSDKMADGMDRFFWIFQLLHEHVAVEVLMKQDISKVLHAGNDLF